MQDKDISNFIKDESFLNYCFSRDAEDVKYWENWLNEHPEHRGAVEELKTTVRLLAQHTIAKEADEQFGILKERILAKESFNGDIVDAPVRKVRLFPWVYKIAAAASILIVLSVAVLVYKFNEQPSLTEQVAKSNIKPGRDLAYLTLGNGLRVVLTGNDAGEIATQAGVRVTKSGNGELLYILDNTTPDTKESFAYNTVETPKGGKYLVNLSDGTKVWLNANSSLRYPTVFKGADRVVQVSGEAYFEVAHNAKMPFKVMNAKQTVEVLGTHFNVMAYKDEAEVKTTLLEGSVKVSTSQIGGRHPDINDRHAGLDPVPRSLSSSRAQSRNLSATGGSFDDVTLKPGQQSQVSTKGINVISGADLEDAIAWKNGYFKFNEDLESIMNKIARWYDVQVVYESKPDTNLALEGKISRTRNIDEVLSMLEYTGNVHFKLEGRRVVVTK